MAKLTFDGRQPQVGECPFPLKRPIVPTLLSKIGIKLERGLEQVLAERRRG